MSLIIIATIIAYSNTFHSSFQFDDIRVILEDPIIKNNSFLHSSQFWTNINYRPLALYSFSFDYALSGASPTSYHITNLVIHICTGAVLFFLISFILKINNLRDKYLCLPLIAMGLFLLHPIQTQAVTYIVQRMTSLFVLFYMASMLFYLKGRYYFLHKKTFQSILFFSLTGLTAIAAILTKQTAASLPIMLLALEIFIIRKPNGKAPLKMISLQGSIFALALIYLFTIADLPTATHATTRFNYFITEQVVFLKYIKLLLIPVNQNIDHLHQFSDTLWATKELISLSIVCLILAGGVFIAFYNRLIAFAIFSIFIALSIESTIFPIDDTMVEHRLYLPMLGFSILAGIGIERIIKHKRLKYVTAVLLLLFTSLTYSRNEAWKTTESLWLDSCEKNPDNYRAWSNYGYSQLKKKNYTEAVKHYKKSLYLNAGNIKALDNLAYIYIQQGEYEKAEQYTKMLLHKNKHYAEAYANYALLEIGRKNIDEAEKRIRKAIKLHPQHYKYYFIYGQVAIEKKDFDLATKMFKRTISLKPDFSAAIDLLKTVNNEHNKN